MCVYIAVRSMTTPTDAAEEKRFKTPPWMSTTDTLQRAPLGCSGCLPPRKEVQSALGVSKACRARDEQHYMVRGTRVEPSGKEEELEEEWRNSGVRSWNGQRRKCHFCSCTPAAEHGSTPYSVGRTRFPPATSTKEQEDSRDRNARRSSFTDLRSLQASIVQRKEKGRGLNGYRSNDNMK